MIKNYEELLDNKKKEILEGIRNLSFEELLNLAQDIESYNGALEGWRINDKEFFDCYFDGDTLGAVRAVCYGTYNYSDDYVKFDAYGNLESGNQWDVQEDILLEEDTILDEILENHHELDVPRSLMDLIEEYEELEEEQENAEELEEE